MPREVKFFKQDTIIVIKCLLRHDRQIVLEKLQKFKDFQDHLKNSKINNEIQALSRISRPAGYPVITISYYELYFTM